MSALFEQVIENIGEMSFSERALLAHCLISSLESKQDDGVDDTWAELGKTRLLELESGAFQGVSWEAIKQQVVLHEQGSGDYTKERHETLGNPSVDELFDAIDNSIS